MNRAKLMRGGQVFVMNLSDVPHGELIGSKDFEDGRHIDFYKTLPGTKVMAYDEETGLPKWVDASGWSRHTGSKVELVQLSNGDTITTDNDPRAVFGIPKDAIDLAVDRDTPTNALKRGFMIPIMENPPETTPVFPSIDILNGGRLTNNHPDPSKGILKADYDLGQFFGLMTGDGWWSKKEYQGILGTLFSGQFHLSDSEGFNAAFITDYLKRMFGDVKVHKKEFLKADHPDRYGDTIRWTFQYPYSDDMCRAMSAILDGEGDDITTGSANKKIPFWFNSLSKDFRLGLLNGIVATDGSISLNTSGKRNHPELLIQISSTSRTLIEDVKALCSGLGIRSTITFSKTTVRGNAFWSLVLSSIDCKRENAFNMCCHERKRDVFLSAEVSFDAKSVRNDHVPLTAQVVSALSKYVIPYDRENIVIDLCPLKDFAGKSRSVYSSLRQYKDTGRITRDFVSRVCSYVEDWFKLVFWFNDYIKSFRDRLLKGERVFYEKEVDTLIYGLMFNKEFFPGKDVMRTRAKARTILQQSARHFPNTLVEELKDFILPENAHLFDPVTDDPVVKRWIALSTAPIKWAYIKEVQKTNQIEEGYDLTVPGYETFASAGGVILSNTMTYYVPVSQKAVEEANRLMLPSKNQLAARDFNILPELQEELVSGAFLASRKKNTPPKAVFNTKAEALDAYRRGLISVDDNIVIRDQNG